MTDTRIHRVALVTGASRGIGQCIAQTLHAGRFKVAGVSIKNRATTGDEWFQCDVSDAAQVRETVQAIIASFGRIDILVNSAGIAEYAALTETSLDLWNRTIAVNLTGTFLMMREVLPLMCRQGWGRIVNVASTAAKRGEPQMAAYATSKHALLGLTRSAALQVAKTGVTVNAICPGPVPTDLLESGICGWAAQTGRPVEVGRKVFQASSPQNRFVDVCEVANLVSFVVSDEARGINGQSINLCGGAVPV